MPRASWPVVTDMAGEDLDVAARLAAGVDPARRIAAVPTSGASIRIAPAALIASTPIWPVPMVTTVVPGSASKAIDASPRPWRSTPTSPSCAGSSSTKTPSASATVRSSTGMSGVA